MDQLELLREIARRLERIEEKQDAAAERTANLSERVAKTETTLDGMKTGIRLLATSVIAIFGYLVKSFVESFRA
jgi:uncharacterized coiled-coil protein SlyX